MADVATIDTAGSMALRATSVATYGGAGSAVVFGLNANEVAAYGGLLVALIAGLANVVINWYWRRRHYQLAEQEMVERRQQDLPVIHDRRQQTGNIRIPVAVLTLSASALVGIALQEGYRSDAHVPVPGDVPTIGFGTTAGVRLGDYTTPERALVQLLADASRFERAVKRCAPVPMHPHEFSAFVSLTYNIGEGAFCGSTAAKQLRASDYAGACREILRWNRFQGRVLPGLTARRRAEHELCIGAG